MVSSRRTGAQHFDVIVIGGGQAGLSVGYHLARRGLRFLILDAHDRVGDSWRKRWDSLRLFTPARFDALVGMPFPLPDHEFPTHEQMADYLEKYAEHFELPIRHRARVESLTHKDGKYVVRGSGFELEADQVIVAMASYQVPRRPAFTEALDSRIVQMHSSEYRNVEQLRSGDTLIVGAANSGAEIALDLARNGKSALLAGRDVGQVAFRIASFWGRWLLGPLLLRFIFHHVLTVRTPIGRKARLKMQGAAVPLIRTLAQDLVEAGIARCARVKGVEAGLPVLEDGTRCDVANVIWCTGFHPGFSWIELPIFDENGRPRHEAGIVPSAPGLYFVGLHFLYAVSSTMIHGVGRDAARIVGAAAKRAAMSEKS